MTLVLSTLQKSEFLTLIISFFHYFLCQNRDPWHKMSEKTPISIFSTFSFKKTRLFDVVQENHLQSCKQYSISFFQQMWGFLFNDPLIKIVNLGKIETSQQSNFEILNFDTYNLTYDWSSISHFKSKAFRKEKSVGHTIESNVS